MVPNNQDKQLQVPWSDSSTNMNTSIVLDQPGTASFTNLDEISGKVVVRCAKSSDVQSILVKLEGESRTRLLSSAGPQGQKPKPQLEYHKILYKVQMAFPSAHIMEGRSWTVSKGAYTLSQGTHEFPFKFKLPFNNQCHSEKSQMPAVSMSGSGLEVAKPSNQHVKQTLPPTLSGFPGEAEVRYFLKATVARHGFWKGSTRTFAPFNFFPIEPPRPALSGTEVFARQKHTFSPHAEDESGKSKMKSLFSKAKDQSSSPSSKDGATISIDARLPEPAILTCNEDVPLRLIVKKLNQGDSMVHLQSLQVSLNGSTKIRAHDVFRTETNSWVLMSKSNMGVPIGATSDTVDTETVLPDHLWRGQSLPATVAPSFQTCNISRTYQLDVRIGLSYTGAMQSTAKPQTVVLPLRLDVEVYSGIAPPRELLEAMAEAKASIQRASTARSSISTDEKLRAEGRKGSTAEVPMTSIDASAPSGIPAQQGSSHPAAPPLYSDAPPSYEDAIATTLPPIDARRPEYAPPAAAEDSELRGDEKKGIFGKGDDSD